MTYQAARLVIGQTTFTSQNSGASDTVLGSASGIAFAANTLFVADGNRIGFTPLNNRVLLFSGVTQSMPSPTASIPVNAGRCVVCLGQATLVLGQTDFVSQGYSISQTGMRDPTAVGSDGRVLVVADTLNNRVLVWRSIPTANGQPADVVLGQPDFNTVGPVVVNASSFRAPQGVWVQNGKLYIADTQNNRVMIWNSIPTTNNQPADLVLGQPNFTSAPVLDLTQSHLVAAANTMLNPVAVTSDGTHLFVTDLGFNRVLIWNSIPTQTQQPADLEVGQPDMISSAANNSFSTDSNGVQSPVLCTVSTGIDTKNNPTYPAACAATLNFPRFALSDGRRLYIADGGNDRVLVYNTIPTQNAALADEILGQPDEFSDILTGTGNVSTRNPTTPNLVQSASNVTPTPTSLAWDGTNLYVADPTNFRVLVFTPSEPDIAATGVRNAAIIEIFASDRVLFSGAINATDKVTVTICPPVNGTAITATCATATGTDYAYTIQTNDTFDSVLQGLTNLINAGTGNPSVFARPGLGLQFLELHAKVPGTDGNKTTVAATVSTSAQITASVASPTLTGGNSPTTIGPGSLIAILGNNLADAAASADPTAQALPFELGGVQVYVDGIRLPLVYVSPTQINAQMPFEVIDANSTSLYARIQHADGSVSATNAVGIPVDLQVPGLFAEPGVDPRVAIAFHGSSYATGVVSVDGTITAGEIATLSARDRSYTYTVQSTDTLVTIRDAFVALINAVPDEEVVASAAPAFTRIVLRAKIRGPQGNGIEIAASSAVSPTATAGTATTLVMTAANSVLCCANVAGARITRDNPALAGEMIYLYATGLGIVGPDDAKLAIVDGAAYQGPAANSPNAPVSSQAGGVTPNVISAGLMVGGIGIYQVVLQLGPSTATDPNSQVTISQDIYTSNVVTIPVYSASPPPPSQ